MREKLIRNILGIIGDCDLYAFEDWSQIEELCKDLGLPQDDKGAYVCDEIRIYCGLCCAVLAGDANIISHKDLWQLIS